MAMSHAPRKDHTASHDTTESSRNTHFTAPLTSPEPETKQEHPVLEIIKFSILALLIVVPIRMFVAQPFIVSGASMEDTFQNSDYLIVDQLSYYTRDPKRGDVAIFRYPRDPSKFFIKRIIGVPGDTVVIENESVIIRNDSFPAGVKLQEPYVDDMQPNSYQKETLGANEYFVMGDNRDESSDSRVWGVLQEEYIIGRALVRLFPPSEFEILPGEYSQTTLSTTSNST
jgi:signal peptidase I